MNWDYLLEKLFHVLLYGMCDGAQQRGGDCYLFDYTEKKQADGMAGVTGTGPRLLKIYNNYLDLELFELNLIFRFAKNI